jgi:hypothetical protein
MASLCTSTKDNNSLVPVEGQGGRMGDRSTAGRLVWERRRITVLKFNLKETQPEDVIEQLQGLLRELSPEVVAQTRLQAK